MKARLFLLLCLLSLLLITAAFPQAGLDPNTTGVVVRRQIALQGADPANPAAPKGAPVRVYDTTGGGGILLSRITVANNSKKTVTALEYGWRIAAPTACNESTFPARWGTAIVRLNRLSPGEQIELDTPKSLSREGSESDLATEARAHKASVVLVTVGILWVTFADGSPWKDKDALQSKTFDGGLYEKENDCHAPAVSEMLRKTN